MLLPNVRKIFTPDPGFTLFEADLAGADAQVVAWEAGDEKLKDIFRNKKPLHLINAQDIFSDAQLRSLSRDKKGDSLCKENPRLNKLRQRAKIGVHATNYGCQPPTLSPQWEKRLHFSVNGFSNILKFLLGTKKSNRTSFLAELYLIGLVINASTLTGLKVCYHKHSHGFHNQLSLSQLTKPGSTFQLICQQCKSSFKCTTPS